MSKVSEVIAEIKPLLIERKVKALYHTKLSDPVEGFPGVSALYYFYTVLQLDNNCKYLLYAFGISPWERNEELFEVIPEDWSSIDPNVQFLGHRIVDVLFDENEECYLLLENGVIIAHTIGWGDDIAIMLYSEYFYPPASPLTSE